MKAKKLVAAALIGVAAVVGTAYGVGTSMKKKEQPVEVTPVPSVNEAAYGDMGVNTLYGTIISKDTQSVELDTSHEITKVYVKAGDRVKKGDVLLTYNMEMDKLKREAQDLTKQGLTLSLENMKKDLATLESGRFPENYGSTDTFFNGGGGFSDDDDSSGGDSGSSYADMEEEDSSYTGAGDGSAGITDDAEENQTPDSGEETGIEDAVQPDDSGDTSADDGSGSQVIIDGDDSGSFLPMDDGIVGDDDSQQEDAEPTEEVLTAVNTFLNDVNTLTAAANGSWDDLSSSSSQKLFEEAFSIYRGKLSSSGETTVTDLFGESRTVAVYQVNDVVKLMVGDSTAEVLKEAYDRLTVYQFISKVRGIFPGQSAASSSYDYETVSAVSDRVHAAADAFYDLQSGVYSVNEAGEVLFSSQFSALNGAFGGESYGQYLTGLIHILNSNPNTIFPDYETEEPMTEMPDMNGGDDFGGDTAPSDGEDLKTAIEQQKKNIVECQLQIREAELSIREYDRTLSHETVKADMDGIVKQAGTTTEQPSSGDFIVITGKAGMYVQGTLSERSLDTMKVGDVINGTSWDTGSTFTARITEISEYPMESGDNMMYFDMSNDHNSSQYPFLAYIDNAEGLSVSSTVELNMETSGSSDKLMLDPYMVRTDQGGKVYCFVEGEDGKLEKRYLRTKDSYYGYVIVLSGLRAEDYIAFPYGDDVKEGAPVTEVDSLSAVTGDDVMLG